MKKTSRLFLFALLLFFSAPIFLMILLSFLPSHTANSFLIEEGISKPSFFHLSLEQYVFALSDRSFLRMYKNSLILTFASLLFNLPVSFFSGLLLNRIKLRWTAFLKFLYLIAILIPFQIIMLPTYKLSIMLDIYDSHWSIILLNAFSPLGAVIMSILIGMIPSSQWEAARLETDSAFVIMYYILLPQLTPGIIALGILIFSQTWNMIEQPLTLLSNSRLFPLSLAFNDILSRNLNYTFAGSFLYALPSFFFFVLTIIFLKGKKLDDLTLTIDQF